MAESENLELKHRTAAKGSENSGRESRQKMPARESKGERQLPVYQSDRSLREPQIARSNQFPQLSLDSTFSGGKTEQNIKSNIVSLAADVVFPVDLFGRYR